MHGLAVINWADDNEQLSVDLVDTADGSRTTIASGGSIGLGAINPSATYVYWTTIDSRKMSGLWRRAVSGGPAEKILAGADVAGPFVDFSLDGKYVVLSGRHGDTGGWDYSVFDADLKPVGQLLDGQYGQVVGFLDDHGLVVGPPSTDDLPPTVPLWALDIHDWSAKKIMSINSEARLAIIPAADGTPRLVLEGRDAENHYTLNELDPDGSTHVLFVGETLADGASWDDLANAMVFPTTSRGIEAPGWLAVFPQAQAMSQAALTGGDQGLRSLVRMSDGELVAIPALTLTQ